MRRTGRYERRTDEADETRKVIRSTEKTSTTCAPSDSEPFGVALKQACASRFERALTRDGRLANARTGTRAVSPARTRLREARSTRRVPRAVGEHQSPAAHRLRKRVAAGARGVGPGAGAPCVGDFDPAGAGGRAGRGDWHGSGPPPRAIDGKVD